MGVALKLSYNMQVLILLSTVASMAVAAPNVGAHQSVQFGNGPAVASGFFNPPPAPAVAPSFQPQAAFNGQPQFSQQAVLQRQPLVQPGFNGFQGFQGRPQ